MMNLDGKHGAPDQSEIDAYQAKAAGAQIGVIRASAKMAECEEALAYARADVTAAQTVVAKCNVEGAELQARVNYAQSAQSRLSVSGAIPGIRAPHR